MHRIVVTDYQYESIQTQYDMAEEAGDIELLAYQCKTEQDVIDACAGAEVLISQYAPITAHVLSKLPNLKAAVRYGIGTDTIDSAAAERLGIYVCNVPDYGIDDTANHTLALLFAMMRKLPVVAADVKGGGWNINCAKPLYRFAGSTVGLVGFGRIARDVARKLSVFGVKIIACAPHTTAEDMAQYGVEKAAFSEVVSKSDFISLHCPATKETFHMIDAGAFQKMKNTAFLINCARGSVVDQQALEQALQREEIAGAALDVLEEEPIAMDSPLLKMDNVLVTSHVGGYSEQAILALQQGVMREAIHIVHAGKPIHPVNRPQKAGRYR